MRKLVVMLPLLFAVATTPVVASSGILDGLTYRGDIGPKGEAANGKDDVIFANGALHSTACDKYGFGPGTYIAVRNGDAVTFTATTKSKTEGTITWQGTIRNGVLEGTFACRKLQTTTDYWIKAKKQ